MRLEIYKTRFLVVILGCIVPLTFNIVFLSKFLAIILSFLTGLTEDLTRIASSLPFATIENIGITTAECIFLMFTVFLVTHFLLKKESVLFVEARLNNSKKLKLCSISFSLHSSKLSC